MTLSNSMRCAVAAVVMGAGLVGCGPEEMAEDVAPEAAPVAEAVPEEKTGTVEAQAICDTCPEVEPGGTGGVNTTPRIEWYEGNNATQDKLGTTYQPPAGGFISGDLTLGWPISITNDEARSAVLKYVPAGTTIVLCDCPHPPGQREIGGWQCEGIDDMAHITTAGTIKNLVIPTFDGFGGQRDWWARFFDAGGGNGTADIAYRAGRDPTNSWYYRAQLDGKVSVIQVFAPGVNPNIIGCDY